AAKAFEVVAGRHEPGWADEASKEAGRLRARMGKARQAWDDALDRSMAFVRSESGAPPQDRALLEAPVLRYMVYEAVKVRGPLEELERLVAATGDDPWHHTWALKFKAEALQRAGRDEESRTTLEGAVKQCDQAKLEYRCLELRVALTDAYDRATRLGAGLEVA